MRKAIDDLRQRHYESLQEEDSRYRPLVGYLDARMAMAEGHWREACTGFEQSRRAVLTPEGVDLRKLVDMSIGLCYGRMGSVDQQIDALRRALKTDPSLASARLALAEALLSSGNTEEALREFRELDRQKKLNPAGMISLARLLIYQTARQPAAQRDWTGVEKLLSTAEKAAPDALPLPLVRGQLLLAQNRVAEATSLWQQALVKSPQRADLWQALINVAEGQQDWAKTERLLEQARNALGDTVEQRLLEAQFLVQRGDPKVEDPKLIERVRKLAENADRFTKDQRAQLWTGLAGAATLANNPQYAKQLLQKIAQQDPNNVQVRYQLVEQALRGREDAELEQALAELKKVVGEDAYWHYGQARRISASVEEKKLNQAEAERVLAEALQHLARRASCARPGRASWR